MDFCSLAQDAPSFTGFSLIFPAVSVGNVGQLACDLLISSLKLKKAGYLKSECVLPIIGSNLFSSEGKNSLTLSLEIFVDMDMKLAVLQQRAPAVPGKQNEFTKQLVSWVNSQQFYEVVLLSSCHAYERKDEEIQGSPVKFLAPFGEKIKSELLERNLSELKQRTTEFGKNVYFMPGGGIAKLFHAEIMETTPKFNSVILMIFCSEGDNIPEALTLVNALNIWKNYLPKSNEGKVPWIFPTSWKHLYGAQQPAAIF